jgi:hypothetical protein
MAKGKGNEEIVLQAEMSGKCKEDRQTAAGLLQESRKVAYERPKAVCECDKQDRERLPDFRSFILFAPFAAYAWNLPGVSDSNYRPL